MEGIYPGKATMNKKRSDTAALLWLGLACPSPLAIAFSPDGHPPGFLVVFARRA